jgi:hypothetical protein
VSKEYQDRYVNCINWIIKWSEWYWWAWDAVKDVTRVLRFPWYNHMKEEPYMCKFIESTWLKYTLEDLEKAFPYTPEKVYVQQDNLYEPTDPVAMAVQALDIKDIFQKAMQSLWRSVEYDNQNRIILDWRLSWWFVSTVHEWTISTTSNEPFKWNRVTVVADALNINNKEAYKWIIDAFNLDRKKVIAQKHIQKMQEAPKVKTKNKRYTWWTDELNYNFAILKPTTLSIITWERWDGKTTYSFFMAHKNAKLWHKVLFLSLEMDSMQIYEDIARRYAWITIEEEFKQTISEIKQNAYEKKIRELQNIPNLYMKWIRRGLWLNWEGIKLLIAEMDYDMVYIDNLDLIQGNDWQKDLDKQKQIIMEIMSFTSDKQIPVFLLHHYRKKSWWAKTTARSMDDLWWSWKIADGCDVFLHVIRKHKTSEDADEKSETTLFLEKARGYQPAIKKIYFKQWSFTDTVPAKIKAIQSLEQLQTN